MVPSTTAAARPTSVLDWGSRLATSAVSSRSISESRQISSLGPVELISLGGFSTTPISPMPRSPSPRGLAASASTTARSGTCSDRLVADGGLTLRLPFRPPLAWGTMLDYFASRAIPGVELVSVAGYRRTINVDGDPGVLEFLPGGPDHLLLRVHLPHWEGLIHLVQRARRVFNLDFDLEAATNHLGSDPFIAALVRAQAGIRPPGAWDPFETGVRAIIGQQVSVAAATTIAGRLVERYGTPVPGLARLGLGRLFPTPATLAHNELGGLGLPSSRAAAVRSFAQAVADDTIQLDRSVPLDALVASISAIPGLGPWTAHYIALRLGEPDAFPSTDLGLERAITRLLPSRDLDVAAMAETWRPWRAHAAVHLWMASPLPSRRAASPAPRARPDQPQLANSR